MVLVLALFLPCPILALVQFQSRCNPFSFSSTESHYKDALLRRCCLDGLRDIPMRYSCTRRSLYITEGSECIRAFRYCCGTYRDEPIDPNMPTTPAPVTTTTTRAPLIVAREDGVLNSRIFLEREMFGQCLDLG